PPVPHFTNRSLQLPHPKDDREGHEEGWRRHAPPRWFLQVHAALPICVSLLFMQEFPDLAEYFAVDLFGKRRVERKSMPPPVVEHVKTEALEQVTAALPHVAAVKLRDQALQRGVPGERRRL